MDSETRADNDEATRTDALPGAPPWQAAIRAAADAAYERNPGSPPGPETLARIGRLLYPRP
jgi:hypothetical protein